MDEIKDLFEQYVTVNTAIEDIDHGAAYVSINTVRGSINTENIFDSPTYLEQMRGDLLYYRQDLRHQLIDILQEEDAGELGIDISEVEPFPVGTPKNDYRKHGTDTDDGR
jgi:hypothetical protein